MFVVVFLLTKIDLPHIGGDRIPIAVSRLSSLVCSTVVRAYVALLCLAGLFAPLHQAIAAATEYRLGEIAAEDVITPVSLVVLNPEATDALKERVAQQAPFIYRFTPQTAADIEAEVRGMVASARTKFITALDALQDHPATVADIGTPVYVAALEYTAHSFTRTFPLEKLVAIWLRKESDQPLTESVIKPLREVMGLPVTSGDGMETPLPPGSSVRLVPVKDVAATPSPKAVEGSGQTVPSSRLITLARAQHNVTSSFPAGQEQIGAFAASFIRPNAFVDTALTEVVRAKRTSSLAVNDTYEAAQVIVHKGQTIDRRALAALAVMREKSLIGTLQTKLAQEQTVAGQIKSQTIWIAAGLGLMASALVLIFLRLRSRTSNALVAAGNAGQSSGDAAWQTRALIAEDKAERAHEAIRSGAMGWMRDKLFRTMFHQREELLTAQKSAEVDMKDLEQRLEQLHTPLQERHAAYEKRIADLEQALAAKAAAAAVPTPPPPAPGVAPSVATSIPAPYIATGPVITTTTTSSNPVAVSAFAGPSPEELERNNRRELELRLKQLQTPLQQQIREYETRIGELEQELVARERPHAVPRSIFSRTDDPDRSVRRREATLAEREQAIAEAEQRVAERARDLNELDALLRAREALIAAQNARPSADAAVPKMKGAEALKQFRAQLGLEEEPASAKLPNQTPLS